MRTSPVATHSRRNFFEQIGGKARKSKQIMSGRRNPTRNRAEKKDATQHADQPPQRPPRQHPQQKGLQHLEQNTQPRAETSPRQTTLPIHQVSSDDGLPCEHCRISRNTCDHLFPACTTRSSMHLPCVYRHSGIQLRVPLAETRPQNSGTTLADPAAYINTYTDSPLQHIHAGNCTLTKAAAATPERSSHMATTGVHLDSIYR
jgi:hypothetical protein